MGSKKIWEQSKLRQWWHNCLFYNDYRRLRRYLKSNGAGIKYLMPGHLWVDYIEVVVTTKCNLRCPDCANLMQYYDKPYHVDLDTLLTSVRKLGECFDKCDHIRVLGGEPFLNPDLKYILREISDKKYAKITIVTNATIVPDDPELIEVIRQKNAVVFFSNYPAAQDSQRRFLDLLKREGIRYEISQSSSWMDYGAPVLPVQGKEERTLRRQFLGCHIPCKSLLNGCLYYCPRSGHGYDLGLIDRKPGEYVDILHNTTAQNRREIRRLMWRHKPIEACKYCLRGTDAAGKIPRGK